VNAVEVTRKLYQDGILSKEAAVRVLKTHRRLVKEATIDLTDQIFGFNKYAGMFIGDEEKLKKLFQQSAKEMASSGGKSVLFGKSVKNLLPILGVAGLAALGTGLAHATTSAIHDLGTKKALGKSRQNVFKEFPELKEEKPKTNKYFDMIAKYAPALATNPIVAGTWVKQMINSGVVDPKNIHSLIQAQADWEDIHSMRSPILGLRAAIPQAQNLIRGAFVSGIDPSA